MFNNHSKKIIRINDINIKYVIFNKYYTKITKHVETIFYLTHDNLKDTSYTHININTHPQWPKRAK